MFSIFLKPKICPYILNNPKGTKNEEWPGWTGDRLELKAPWGVCQYQIIG
jgi:hypothetical protein